MMIGLVGAGFVKTGDAVAVFDHARIVGWIGLDPVRINVDCTRWLVGFFKQFSSADEGLCTFLTLQLLALVQQFFGRARMLAE
jgi:hypothetical protein